MRRPRVEAEAEPRAKRRRRRRGQPDVLSSLPPEILDDILSRLEIRNAVRTSTLSRAWRRRWRSVRGLSLCFHSTSVPSAAITSVLRRYAGPIRSLDLVIPARRHRRAARWVRLLPRRRVECLDLEFEFELFVGEPVLDPAVFSCLDLATLRLRGCAVPSPPPAFAGFPKLTKLFLSDVSLPHHGASLLAAVIAAAPLLMDLWISGLSLDGPSERWAVRALNLRSLSMAMDFSDSGCRIEVEDLPRLEEATLRLGCNMSAQDYCHFFRGITHVQTLEFDPDPTPFGGNPLEGLSCTFQNLRTLTVNPDFGNSSSILSVFSVLRCAPNLEDVDIEVEGKENIEIDDGFLNAQTSDDLFPKLQNVWLYSIMCYSSEMCFIKFVLSKARSLQLFRVRVCSDGLLSYEDACIQMATYKRASPLARLRFIRSTH